MAIAFVQARVNNASASGVLTTTLTAAPTTGNLLVAFALTIQSATLPTISGTGWTALTTASGGGGTTRAQAGWYKLAGSGESAAIAVTLAGAGTLSVVEYSGINATTPRLIDNAQVNAAALTQATPIVTPTAGVAALVLCCCWVRVLTSSAPSVTVNASSAGVTVRADIANNNQSASGVASSTTFDLLPDSTSGNYQGGSTWFSSQTGGGAIAIFQASAAVAVLPIPNVIMAPYTPA